MQVLGSNMLISFHSRVADSSDNSLCSSERQPGEETVSVAAFTQIVFCGANLKVKI